MNATDQPPADSTEATAVVGGLLIYVALDWGDEVDLNVRDNSHRPSC